ncbi:hypothetical protein CS542_05815 [Pedobacter sp. IW39]|nr:hypothetical protein CS542_05815 [Pedobacter sp. IW39]
MNKKVRIVHLTGEAFDVAHHESQPFIVRTNKIAIKVLGTAFNVKAYPVDQKSVATLYAVLLNYLSMKGLSKDHLNPSEKFVLQDGQQG